MQDNTTTTPLPENLVSRFSRVYFKDYQFTNDAGEIIPYERLVCEFLVKGEPTALEFKLSKKDKLLLQLSDNLDNATL